MAFKFPDKDPDEKLDYTVDWSRYLQRDDLTIASVTWYIEKSDGSTLAFSEGYSFDNDVLRYATQTANVNGATTASTSVAVDGNSSNGAYGDLIRVGAIVSGVGIVGKPTVVTVTDQNNLVLSTAQTLSDNAVLTFTEPGLTNSLIVTPTNTTTTIVLSEGIANKTYTLVCEITTSASSKTTDSITTNRRIKLKVRERV